MIVYSSDGGGDDEYKSAGHSKTVSICENVQAITSSKLLPKKLSTAGVRLSPENKKFLKQLGFKLKKC